MKTKYRITYEADDCDNAECISCKSNFYISNGSVYKFCPICGLETMPEKRKRRYPPRFDEKDKKLCLNGEVLYSSEKRLVIQISSIINQGISDFGFFPVSFNPPRISPWNLHNHLLLSDSVKGCSSSKFMIDKFHKVCKTYNKVRLLLLDKDKIKIIKEYERIV